MVLLGTARGYRVCRNLWGRLFYTISFMLWADRKDRHLYAPPIAGPRTKIPGKQWRLYLRHVAYHMGMIMEGIVDVRFNLQSVTDQN